MNEKTIIKGLYYSKPVVLIDQRGEAVQGRKGVYILVSGILEWGVNGVLPKKIIFIEYEEDLSAFKVTLAGEPESFIIIPKSGDMEVYYENVAKKEKK